MTAASPLRCLWTGMLMGGFWVGAIVMLFTAYNDPFFGDWSYDPSTLLIALNLGAYLLSLGAVAAGIPAWLDRGFRSARAACWLLAGGALPVVLPVLLLILVRKLSH